ncbi:group 1 glycosyl transferase [Myxococcus stipitatus DSM 14675]|uniref:Group 1 glycosyl transferase n=1 Tax=Myxococcus stipitatus (strain DSM 14675 / JCM 12634 / Mx s8) TaxID=1278073 RepID=L7U4H7_MYXSD|nr:glycosyltransferase family 4 protein [Myxococcus stipitatus]AGC42427.1 group 1 glycosyl transferase [Myxococcus stipitatus DSM 14675]
MRVLFLNPVGVVGGAERALLDLMACLRHLDPRLSLHLLAGTPGPLLDEARALGVDAKLLALPPALSALGDSALRGRGPREALRFARSLAPAPLLLADYGRTLRREVANVQPDVVHSNGIKTHLLSAATTGLRVKRVWHIHDFLGERPLVRRALKTLAPLASVAIANSGAVGEDARAVLRGVPIQVVYNGVDVERFAPAPQACVDLDALAGLPRAPDGTLRVGLVATYARWKGHDVFLDAAAELTRLEPSLPVRFYLVGGPLYQTPGSQFSEDELRQRIDLLELSGRVGLVPFQSEPASIYRALDVFVHASTRREPFGLTIAEALACARPAIVSSESGAAEALTHGVDVLAIPPGDSRSLGDALRTLLRDEPLRTRLAQAARHTAVERFSRERYAREMLTVYRSLMNGG